MSVITIEYDRAYIKQISFEESSKMGAQQTDKYLILDFFCCRLSRNANLNTLNLKQLHFCLVPNCWVNVSKK